MLTVSGSGVEVVLFEVWGADLRFWFGAWVQASGVWVSDSQTRNRHILSTGIAGFR